MWLSSILAAAGTAASGIMSAINNRKMQEEQKAEAARQQAHYDAMANENPLARSENQHLLGQYDREAQRQIENARGVAAITGATPEYNLAVQKGVSEGRANLMGQMAAGASARADKFKELGEQARHQHSLDEIARRKERNDTFAALAANAANAASSLAGIGADGKTPAKAPETVAQVEPATSSTQKLAAGGAVATPSASSQYGSLPQGAPNYVQDPNTGKMSVDYGKPGYQFNPNTGKVELTWS